MSAIDFEDRTVESTTQALTRQVQAVSQLLVHATIQASQGNPSIGLGALALTLGQGAARIGAPLEEVLAAVQRAYEAGAKQITELDSELSDA